MVVFDLLNVESALAFEASALMARVRAIWPDAPPPDGWGRTEPELEDFFMLLRLQTFRRPRGTTPCQELKLVSVADDGLTVVDRIVTVARATVDREEQNLLEAAKFGGPLCDGSYGYRPRRAAQAAVARVEKSIVYGKTRVIDVDPAAYLDAATYCPPIHGWLGKSSG